jgi:hypothetical protein
MTTNVMNKGWFNPLSISVLLILITVSAVFYILQIANIQILALSILFSGLFASAIRIADQWERAVVLRMGKYKSLKGPGSFMIIPIIDSVSTYIDQRVRVSAFKAEQTPYQRYGAGKCGCGRVLDGLGCGKSHFGGAGISKSH